MVEQIVKNLEMSELVMISKFLNEHQVHAYSIYKENETLQLKNEKSHILKKMSIEKTSKIIVKLTTFVSVFAGAIALILDIFVI